MRYFICFVVWVQHRMALCCHIAPKNNIGLDGYDVRFSRYSWCKAVSYKHLQRVLGSLRRLVALARVEI